MTGLLVSQSKGLSQGAPKLPQSAHEAVGVLDSKSIRADDAIVKDLVAVASSKAIDPKDALRDPLSAMLHVCYDDVFQKILKESLPPKSYTDFQRKLNSIRRDMEPQDSAGKPSQEQSQKLLRASILGACKDLLKNTQEKGEFSEAAINDFKSRLDDASSTHRTRLKARLTELFTNIAEVKTADGTTIYETYSSLRPQNVARLINPDNFVRL